MCCNNEHKNMFFVLNLKNHRFAYQYSTQAFPFYSFVHFLLVWQECECMIKDVFYNTLPSCTALVFIIIPCLVVN